MKSILDRSFRYTSAAKTNLKATFRKERERLKQEAARPSAEVIDLTPGNLLLRKVTK